MKRLEGLGTEHFSPQILGHLSSFTAAGGRCRPHTTPPYPTRHGEARSGAHNRTKYIPAFARPRRLATTFLADKCQNLDTLSTLWPRISRAKAA